MTALQDQGEGEIVPGLGFAVVRVLTERCATSTIAALRSGETVSIQGASFGRNIGADWEHIYFDVGGQSFFLSTCEFASMTDPLDGAILYMSEAQ
ncbi:hypothetical protein [Vitreimonas flagellata]|uniref:hypothetical protein n=1 Tax=Vitreimonas flagellata TaxID=2560861 RepID=UPI001074EFC6|nr:hypothetical protein [Vitreimonas flagellata]